MSRPIALDKKMMSLAPFGDADLRQPSEDQAEASVGVVYEGLPGNITGVGAVRPGDALELPRKFALDLVARKCFRLAG